MADACPKDGAGPGRRRASASGYGPERRGAEPVGPDWRARAACRGADTDLFFPVSESGAGRAQARRAKEICAGCPVAAPCAAWALRHPEVYGIWGGLDERDRRAVRRAALARRRARADPAGPAGNPRPYGGGRPRG